MKVNTRSLFDAFLARRLALRRQVRRCEDHIVAADLAGTPVGAAALVPLNLAYDVLAGRVSEPR